ncbi:hypothetical protein AB4158_09430 [Vibrio splendidus]
MIFLLGLISFFNIVKKINKDVYKSTFLMALVLCLPLYISSLYSLFFNNVSYTGLLTIFFIFAIISISLYIVSAGKVGTFLAYIIAITCFANFVGFYLYFVEEVIFFGVTLEYDVLFSKRMNSWFNNSTELGILNGFSLIACVYLFSLRQLKPLVFTLSLVTILIGMLLSGGRTPLIALAFVLFIRMLFNFNYKGLMYGAIFFVSLVISSYVLYEYYYDDIFIIRRFAEGDISGLGGRDEKFELFIQYFGKTGLGDLLFGSGIGFFYELGISIHSGILRTAQELGVVNITIFYLFSFFVIFCSGLKSRDPSTRGFVISSLTYFLFCELMAILLLGPTIYFAIYIFVIVILVCDLNFYGQVEVER